MQSAAKRIVTATSHQPSSRPMLGVAFRAGWKSCQRRCCVWDCEPMTRATVEDESDLGSDASLIQTSHGETHSGPDILIPKMRAEVRLTTWINRRPSTPEKSKDQSDGAHSNQVSVVNLLSDEEEEEEEGDAGSSESDESALSNEETPKIEIPKKISQQQPTAPPCGDCTENFSSGSHKGAVLKTNCLDGYRSCGDVSNGVMRKRRIVLHSSVAPVRSIVGRKRSFLELKVKKDGHRVKLPKWMEYRAEMLSHDGIQEGVTSLGLKNFLEFITQE
ncbi:hypothetical protein BSKO_01618 [Bryopsis sp. KO-2023]|nr:hypothetical protein BSKO_01618 [Bryopsis sp. KO-2023]